MAQLHETMMGKKLITHDIPELVKNIENLGKSLEKINNVLDDMHLIFLKLIEEKNGREARNGKSDINT